MSSFRWLRHIRSTVSCTANHSERRRVVSHCPPPLPRPCGLLLPTIPAGSSSREPGTRQSGGPYEADRRWFERTHRLEDAHAVELPAVEQHLREEHVVVGRRDHAGAAHEQPWRAVALQRVSAGPDHDAQAAPQVARVLRGEAVHLVRRHVEACGNTPRGRKGGSGVGLSWAWCVRQAFVVCEARPSHPMAARLLIEHQHGRAVAAISTHWCRTSGAA